jgi:hypothetical protein
VIRNLLVFFMASSFAINMAWAQPSQDSDPAPTEIYNPWKVWAAAPVSLWLGFGAGHGVQNRFSETGWIYAAADGIGLSLIFLSLGDCSSPNSSCQSDKDQRVNTAKSLLVVSRLAQVIDTSIWSYKYSQKFPATVTFIPSQNAATFLATISF